MKLIRNSETSLIIRSFFGGSDISQNIYDFCIYIFIFTYTYI